MTMWQDAAHIHIEKGLPFYGPPIWRATLDLGDTEVIGEGDTIPGAVRSMLDELDRFVTDWISSVIEDRSQSTPLTPIRGRRPIGPETGEGQ